MLPDAQDFIRDCLTWWVPWYIALLTLLISNRDAHLRPSVHQLRQYKWLTEQKRPKISLRESISEQLQLTDIKNLSLLHVNFGILPVHVALNIFRWLDLNSLCRAGEVCAHWWTVSHHKSLWQSMSCRAWPKLRYHPQFLNSKGKLNPFFFDYVLNESTESDLETAINWKDIYRERDESDMRRQNSRLKHTDFLQGHSKGNTCITVLPSARKIVSGGDTIKIWTINEKSEDPTGAATPKSKYRCRTIKGLSGTVSSLCSNLEETIIVTANQEGGEVISLWYVEAWNCSWLMLIFLNRDIKSKTCKTSLKDESSTSGSICTLHMVTNNLLSSVLDHKSSINIWDIVQYVYHDSIRNVEWLFPRNKIVVKLTGHTRDVRALKSVKEELLVSASSDNTVKLWDLRVGTCQITWTGHTDEVTSLVCTGMSILTLFLLVVLIQKQVAPFLVDHWMVRFVNGY